jgi:peptidoglycan/xylan/chitin deacetylase (PgdA/CDA1 family)
MAVHLMHPLARLSPGHRNVRVPILMYHGIEPPARTGHPYYETSTSPEMFALQMSYLREQGYTVVDLEEALQVMILGQTERKCVAITFDDGYRNFYTHAFPVLAEHGFRATLFLVSGLVQRARVSRNGHEYVNWSEVRELHTSGIRIGSHTVTHPDLQKQTGGALEFEISYSKQDIEDHLGEPVRAFSYPFAFPEANRKFTALLRDLLCLHGYVCGVSTILGTATRDSDWFYLPRLPVNSHDDRRLFQAKLEGSYNWLHFFQYAAKALRAGRS